MHPVAWLDRQMLPPRCLLCGGRATGRDLCGGCRADLPWIARGCRSCGLPLGTWRGDALCGRCLARPPPFERAVIPFIYAFPVDSLLRNLKFTGGQAAGYILGELFADTARHRSGPRPDALLPVPLHASRLKARGYNQAEELARPVARALDLPVLARACRRVRDTPAQSTLDRKSRQDNVAGAFTCAPAVGGLHVAVIDDVMTTGSTLAAIARAVQAAGAVTVSAWCIARAVIPP